MAFTAALAEHRGDSLHRNNSDPVWEAICVTLDGVATELQLVNPRFHYAGGRGFSFRQLHFRCELLERPFCINEEDGLGSRASISRGYDGATTVIRSLLARTAFLPGVDRDMLPPSEAAETADLNVSLLAEWLRPRCRVGSVEFPVEEKTPGDSSCVIL